MESDEGGNGSLGGSESKESMHIPVFSANKKANLSVHLCVLGLCSALKVQE